MGRRNIKVTIEEEGVDTLVLDNIVGVAIVAVGTEETETISRGMTAFEMVLGAKNILEGLLEHSIAKAESYAKEDTCETCGDCCGEENE